MAAQRTVSVEFDGRPTVQELIDELTRMREAAGPDAFVRVRTRNNFNAHGGYPRRLTAEPRTE